MSLVLNLPTLGPSKGRLYVEVQPAEALVRIMNIGPRFEQGMELEPGSYDVLVTADEHEPWRQWVGLAAGEEKRLAASLKRLPAAGSLSVRSEPSGTEWFLDGRYAGRTPGERSPVPAGRYRVEVKKEGYEDWSGADRCGAQQAGGRGGKARQARPESRRHLARAGDRDGVRVGAGGLLSDGLRQLDERLRRRRKAGPRGVRGRVLDGQVRGDPGGVGAGDGQQPVPTSRRAATTRWSR